MPWHAIMITDRDVRNSWTLGAELSNCYYIYDFVHDNVIGLANIGDLLLPTSVTDLSDIVLQRLQSTHHGKMVCFCWRGPTWENRNTTLGLSQQHWELNNLQPFMTRSWSSCTSLACQYSVSNYTRHVYNKHIFCRMHLHILFLKMPWHSEAINKRKAARFARSQ